MLPAMQADAPLINELAERIFGAQIVRKPTSPLGYATLRDAEDRPFATVAVVLGHKNPEMVEPLLDELRDKLHPVNLEIDDEADG